MAKIHILKCSTLLAIMKMQFKTTLTFHVAKVRMAKSGRVRRKEQQNKSNSNQKQKQRNKQ